MKVSNLYLPTLREAPADADSISCQLMLRAGLIRKVASGIYSYLPLGAMILKKIEKIIREELEAQGAQEVLTPGLVPSELYRKAGSGSYDDIFTLRDNSGREFGLTRSFEEAFADIIKNDIKPYKIFPLCFYEIQARYRDERRVRCGVMRSRAFSMKGACSFDLDLQGLDKSYKRMFDTYCSIFDRLGIKYASAQSGGAKGEEEIFIIESEIGDVEIVLCDKCGFRWDVKSAPCSPETAGTEEYKAVEKVYTPDVKTIDELTDFLNIRPQKLAKTLIYKVDGKVIAAMVRGDREISEDKLIALMGVSNIEMADAETVIHATSAQVGFAGPVGIKVDKFIADNEITHMSNMAVGANDTGYHFVNVNYGRDFNADIVADIRKIEEGDRCPECGGNVNIESVIKLGRLSKIGTKYSKPVNAYYVDPSGSEKHIVMGSYSIGIDRVMAAIIEQNHDEQGIVWPMQAAPYQVVIVPAVAVNEEQMKVAEEIYADLKDAGFEVLLDDRDERAGVKFKDADLIGIPIRVTIGKKLGEGIVEYKTRCSGIVEDIKLDDVLCRVIEELKKYCIKK